MNEKYRIEQVDIDKIILWEEVNARKSNVRQGLDELAGNIKKNGLQYPLLVKRDGDRYLVFSGQRRFLACAKAGRTSIPCFVYEDIDINDARVLSLSENLYRLAMDAEDKARACRILLSQHDGDRQAVADALGVSVSTVRNYLGFGALPGEVKKMVGQKSMTAFQATRIFNKFPDEKTALNVIREFANIPKESRKQKQRFYSAASDARPTDSLDDIRKWAKQTEDAVEHRLLLPAKKSRVLEHVAATRLVKKEDVALDFLMDRIDMHERGEW